MMMRKSEQGYLIVDVYKSLEIRFVSEELGMYIGIADGYVNTNGQWESTCMHGWFSTVTDARRAIDIFATQMSTNPYKMGSIEHVVFEQGRNSVRSKS